ncbi:1-deoxy-D-xylulose-5-phosphate reductoisomerase [Treponema sp.]
MSYGALMKKKIIILGATGSIGKSTLDVLRSNPDDFEVVGLSAHTDTALLRSIGSEFPQALLALTKEKKKNSSDTFDFQGVQAALDLIRESNADLVVNGIAGAAGLLPSVAALEAGADLALANKETIVMAGSFILDLAHKKQKRLLPVDSEHSAIFHLLEAHGSGNVEELVLTASGGPFRGCSAEDLSKVSLAQALDHPTWNMGAKITIDSATLANKGLEVIEAVKLFGFNASQVSVLVHPQSRIHSLVRLKDGSLYAQISEPDMRVPIHNALYYPSCRPCTFGRLDLADLVLSFQKPDFMAFPMLDLAYGAARRGGLYPAAYNAANEVAVAAFREERIGFMDIARVTSAVLDGDWEFADDSLDTILDGDRRARMSAERFIAEALYVS